LRAQYQLSGTFTERDAVRSFIYAPLAAFPVAAGEQSRIGRNRHPARLTGLELDVLEAEQAQ
jgi:hypothetical protein